MKFGDQVESGIYVGKINGHLIICSPIQYDLPVEVNWHQAAEYCKSIGMELPTKEELNLLYKLYKRAPAHFPKREYQWYWSSIERSSKSAWGRAFYDGIQSTYAKSLNFCVRPIKRIKIKS